MAEFTQVEIEQLRLLLQKQNELLSIADDAAALEVVAGAGQETINGLSQETAATLNLADKTVIDKFDSSATKSLKMSELISFIRDAIGGGGDEFNKQGHFNWVAGGGDGDPGYKKKDIVYHNGNTYISTADNNITVPGDVGAGWEVFYQDASTSIKGITQLQSTIDDNELNAATPRAINRRDVHIQTNAYKKGAPVQNGAGGAWYEAVQDVPANQALTGNPTYWLPASNFPIFGGVINLTSDTTLDSTHLNQYLKSTTYSSLTHTLPKSANMPIGAVVFVKAKGSGITTIQRSETDVLVFDSVSTRTSIPIRHNGWVELINEGDGVWSGRAQPFYTSQSGTYNRGTTLGNAPIHTNTTGFPIFFDWKVIVSAGSGSLFVARNGFTIKDDVLNTTKTTCNVSFVVMPNETFQLAISSGLTVATSDFFEQKVL